MERGRGRYTAPRNPENSGSSSGFIVLLIVCLCSVLVVLGIYGAAEGSDNNKTGVETLQELFEGKITLEDVFSNIEKGGDTSVPCQGSWSNWGACSEPCGGGTRERTWTTTAEPLYGGAACPSPLTQEEACNTGACPPEPCEGSWGSWSACSAPCGGGIKTKTWTTTKEPKYGGTACPSPKIKTDDCNTQVCPIDCVGEWEVYNNSCDYGCGTEVEGLYYYDIKTSAAHGGNECPHAQDDKKTKNCDLPSCPTVDTTETIGGIKYDVKYYDSADGHNAYMVVYTYDINYPATTTIWNGAGKSSAAYGAVGDPILGSDGHGYLKGVKKKGPYDRSTYYVVKRSQQPIERGTCTLNKAFQYEKKVQDGTSSSDYECAGACTGKNSKSTCESTIKSCDYIFDGVSAYKVWSRERASLSAACKWLLDDEEQELEPKWKTEDINVPGAGTYPYIYKGDVIKTVDGWAGRGDPDALVKTDKKCKRECFKDKSCVAYNLNKEGLNLDVKKTCELLSRVTDKQMWDTSRRGYKIKRKYG